MAEVEDAVSSIAGGARLDGLTIHFEAYVAVNADVAEASAGIQAEAVNHPHFERYVLPSTFAAIRLGANPRILWDTFLRFQSPRAAEILGERATTLGETIGASLTDEIGPALTGNALIMINRLAPLSLIRAESLADYADAIDLMGVFELADSDEAIRILDAMVVASEGAYERVDEEGSIRYATGRGETGIGNLIVRDGMLYLAADRMRRIAQQEPAEGTGAGMSELVSNAQQTGHRRGRQRRLFDLRAPHTGRDAPQLSASRSRPARVPRYARYPGRGVGPGAASQRQPDAKRNGVSDLGAANQSLISVSDLHKTYGRGTAACHALRGVSFDIDKGEWVSITGPSGSGKTTLLNVLGALDAQYDGSVRIDGRELKSLNDKELSGFRGQTIGFVFQHFNLLPHLSVTENVMIPGCFMPSRRDALRRASNLLERVGLGDKLNVRPTELSGGQQQRVSIARALFNKTKLLLCDEPTGALDREAGQQIMRLFTSLNETEDITLIIVTHEGYISRLAQRVLRLVDGRLVDDDSSDTRDTGDIGDASVDGAPEKGAPA